MITTKEKTKKRSRAEPPSPARTARVEEAYGPLHLVAAEWRGESRAAAFAGRTRIEEVKADTVEQALAEIRTRLDQRSARFQAARVDGVPSADEFEDALHVLESSLSEQDIALLRMLAVSRRPLTLDALGVMSLRANAGQAGLRIARRVSMALGFKPDAPEGVGKADAPLMALALPEFDADETRWTLRPELVEALRRRP